MVAIVVAACGARPTEAPPEAPPAAQTPSGGTIHGEAIVDEIDILILESFPVQISVVARGNLPDGCTEIDEIIRQREEQTFNVTITTVRPADAMCTEALVPFEETFSLDVYGLPAGVYRVDVNGITGTFELAVDNVPQTDPEQ
jgi:inhibitor of cysteine peptidase